MTTLACLRGALVAAALAPLAATTTGCGSDGYRCGEGTVEVWERPADSP